MPGVTDRLASLVRAALDAARADGVLAFEDAPEPDFERPKRREHGDWATNVALVAARGRGNPRDVAAALIERLPASDVIARVEVAGPGFLNFYLSPAWLHNVVRRAATPGSGFGRSAGGAGVKVNVEYVSANPTGPINVVSGRHAATGDAVASLLEACGYEVAREYYSNDAGRQARLFGESVAVRYLQLFGIDAELPKDGYRGDYVAAIAKDIAGDVGDRYVDAPEDQRNRVMLDEALARMQVQMRATLERFGTRFDVWFSERSLHESGAVEEGAATLRELGVVKDSDGAVWFTSSRFGDDKDRVLIRSDGQPTYLAADVAYLRDKFGRGFDHLIYLWGADHHGTVPRFLAAADALGFGRDRVEVRLMQIVTLQRGGRAIKASKRAGNLVPLDDLVDEVGADAARYTFLTRSMDAPLEFDIEVAREQAPENPVYYVQYAHARICSILRKAEGEGATTDVAAAALGRLGHPSEDELVRKLASYEEVVPEAAEMRVPQRVTRYVEELASTFSGFYRDCRVVSDDRELTGARLALCLATKAVIADALGLLGVAAPERM